MQMESTDNSSQQQQGRGSIERNGQKHGGIQQNQSCINGGRQHSTAASAATATAAAAAAAATLQQHFFHSNGPPPAPPPQSSFQTQNGAFGNGSPQQQVTAGGNDAMQAFANLGLFCPASGHHQFPGVTNAPPVPSHLAAAAAAAASYGQRLMGTAAVQLPVNGQNGTGAIAAKRNFGSSIGHGPTSSSSAPPAHISSSSSASSSAINRSQRCGVCRGCQCKPCGQCTYCQDSPQFGGPGVKKQSCIERRCLRVLENRLQRDAPTFKARIGCNACEDCRSADCQICLVCLDRRFFNSKYMVGALCAKKRCNNATALELPISGDRGSLKRPSADGFSVCQQQQQHLAKRQILIPSSTGGGIPTAGSAHQLNSNIARILSAANDNGNHQKFVGSPKNAFDRGAGPNSTGSTNNDTAGMAQTVPPSLMAAVPQLGRPFWSPPTQMLGVLPGHYHFDQMASLAAAAAVGFPQYHQTGTTSHHYPSPYQPKFLNYPKYEYFTAEEGTNGLPNGTSAADSFGAIMDGSGRAQIGEGGGGNPGAAADNLLVPPSYSDVQKVVLQPL